MRTKAEQQRKIRQQKRKIRQQINDAEIYQPRVLHELIHQTTPALRRIRRRLGGPLNLFGMYLCDEAWLRLDLSRLILKSRELS